MHGGACLPKWNAQHADASIAPQPSAPTAPTIFHHTHDQFIEKRVVSVPPSALNFEFNIYLEHRHQRRNANASRTEDNHRVRVHWYTDLTIGPLHLCVSMCEKVCVSMCEQVCVSAWVSAWVLYAGACACARGCVCVHLYACLYACACAYERSSDGLKCVDHGWWWCGRFSFIKKKNDVYVNVYIFYASRWLP